MRAGFLPRKQSFQNGRRISQHPHSSGVGRGGEGRDLHDSGVGGSVDGYLHLLEHGQESSLMMDV